MGGMGNTAKMGISVGVSFSTETGRYHIFTEETIAELVDQVVKADLVVGFNHLRFDYGVLQPHTVYDLPSQTVNCDILVELEKVLGHRVPLNSVAEATLGMGKTANGLDALRWWQKYQKTGGISHLMDIAEYCCYDVKVTKEVYEYAREHGELKYLDKGKNLQTVKIELG